MLVFHKNSAQSSNNVTKNAVNEEGKVEYKKKLDWTPCGELSLERCYFIGL